MRNLLIAHKQNFEKPESINSQFKRPICVVVSMPCPMKVFQIVVTM
jgi:hypothetical protein